MYRFCFSPTAIALESSAIVKVSGQNCFWTLYGSLGQICLGLPKGSAEGSTKVPARVHQRSTSSVASLVLWGRSVLGRQKVPWKVPPRFQQGCTTVLQVSWCLWFWGRSVLGRQKVLFTKVPARFHQGSTNVLQVSWCLWFSGADPSWAAKRFRVIMSHPYTSSQQKATHHVVSVEVFFGQRSRKLSIWSEVRCL